MQPPNPSLPRDPIGLALVLAQSVDYDAETGLWGIIGPYSEMTPESYPASYLTMEVYAVLTECDGDVLVEVRLVDAADRRPPVFRQLVSVHFDGPRDVQEMVFHQFNVIIPVEGEYRLQLCVHGPGRPVQAQGVFVIERKLVMRESL